MDSPALERPPGVADAQIVQRLRAECVQIAPHNLLTQSVGQSDDPCGDVAATVREIRDRLINVVKI